VKNALILHGTGGSSQENWFPWLKVELEKREYRVWVPDLPQADRPDAKQWTEFLLANPDWAFNEDSIIIGHSAGAVEIFALLQSLPEGTQINLAILVAAFTEDLATQSNWSELTGLFTTPFAFDTIKRRARQFVFVHSDNDPYCPVEYARDLATLTGGQLVLLPDRQHFSASLTPPVTKLSELLPIIEGPTG
jgi:uncharacterized protein